MMRVFGLNRLLHIQNLKKTSYLITSYGSKSHVVEQLNRRKLHQYGKTQKKRILKIVKNHQERETLDNKHWHVQEGEELQKIYGKIEELGYKVKIPKQNVLEKEEHYKSSVSVKQYMSELVSEEGKTNKELHNSGIENLTKSKFKSSVKKKKRKKENKDDRLVQSLKILFTPKQVSDESQMRIDDTKDDSNHDNGNNTVDTTKKSDSKSSDMQRHGDKQKEQTGRKTEHDNDELLDELLDKGRENEIKLNSEKENTQFCEKYRDRNRGKIKRGKKTENEVIEKECNKDYMIKEKKLMNSLRKEMYCIPEHSMETLTFLKRNNNENGKIIDVMFSLQLKQNWKITLSAFRDRFVKDCQLLFEFLLFTFWKLKYNYPFCYRTLNLGLENNNFPSKNTNSFILKCDKSDDNIFLDRSSASRTSNTTEEDLSDFSDIEDVEDVGEAWESPVPLTRGKHGVFDLEDLVDLVKVEKAVDICVIEIPKDTGIAEHMVIVSAMSTRHMKALFQTVNWVYKRKKSRKDPYLDTEGKHMNDWLALHMGNIILHIFMPETRQYYDLETLWTVGPEFDEKSPDIASMGLYSISQSDMEWLEELEKTSTPSKSSRPKR